MIIVLRNAKRRKRMLAHLPLVFCNLYFSFLDKRPILIPCRAKKKHESTLWILLIRGDYYCYYLPCTCPPSNICRSDTPCSFSYSRQWSHMRDSTSMCSWFCAVCSACKSPFLFHIKEKFFFTWSNLKVFNNKHQSHLTLETWPWSILFLKSLLDQVKIKNVLWKKKKFHFFLIYFLQTNFNLNS